MIVNEYAELLTIVLFMINQQHCNYLSINFNKAATNA